MIDLMFWGVGTKQAVSTDITHCSSHTQNFNSHYKTQLCLNSCTFPRTLSCPRGFYLYGYMRFVLAKYKYSTIISKHSMRNCKKESPDAKSIADWGLHCFASTPVNKLYCLLTCSLLSYCAFYLAFVQNMIL